MTGFLPLDRSALYSPAWFVPFDEHAQQVRSAGVSAYLDRWDAEDRAWVAQDTSAVRTPSAAITYPGLGRRGRPGPQRYRARFATGRRDRAATHSPDRFLRGGTAGRDLPRRRPAPISTATVSGYDAAARRVELDTPLPAEVKAARGDYVQAAPRNTAARTLEFSASSSTPATVDLG